jgi:hypothetical protein
MADMKVSVLEQPDSSKGIDYVVSNKGRLLPSRFAKLPVGSVRPKGWIAYQLQLMVDGQTGRLQELSSFLAEDNGWFGTEKDGWEEQPYWLRGFYSLGVLTGDSRIRKESLRWIEKVIATQQEDGYFGPRNQKAVRGKDGRIVVDLWPHMVMIDALRSHWECTGDERIIQMLLKFFRFCQNIPDDQFLPHGYPEFGDWRPFVQKERAGDMLPHIYWLYNITGEEWLLDVATRFHERVKPPEGEWLVAHVVSFTQRFREPGTYYLQSHDPRHLEETEYWYEKHHATWGQQPGGIFAADECIRPGKTDPKQGFETCAMVEYNKSFYILGQITGEAKYADRVEDIIFNSFPVSQLPTLKGLHYLTAGNQPQLDASTNHDYMNKGRQIDYSPHIYRCCQHNVAMGWPYYAEHLWMAAPGNGLVAWLYGASEVTAKVGNGEEITIIEETNYPFDTYVRMRISADSEVEFPLYLRVPKWCEGFAVRVNGKKVNVAPDPMQYVVVERTWHDGDVVEIEMPVKLSLTVWEKHGNSVTVNRGSLSYSLKIGERWVRERSETSTDEWPDWEVFPTTPWNYGLVINWDNLETSFQVVEKGVVPDQPWTLENAPIEIKAKGKKIPNWVMIDETVTDLQPSPVKSDEPLEDITLVPMGCARLRMSVLPVIGTGPDAREWVKVTSHEEAMKLRLGM